MRASIWIAAGANVAGLWGAPPQTIAEALRRLQRAGVIVRAVSPLYASPPMGPPGQPPYANLVFEIATPLGPEPLLMLLKRLERESGRRSGIRWGPRPLDLDIIDYHGVKGRRQGLAVRGRASPLFLPHIGIADRIFVLQPLLDLAPLWVHPISRAPGHRLLKRLRMNGAKLARHDEQIVHDPATGLVAVHPQTA